MRPMFDFHRIWTGRLAATGVMSILGLGCVHFESKPISPAKVVGNFEQRSLENPELKSFLAQNGPTNALLNWPLAEWDLSHLILVGLFYHPDLDLARAHWAVAQASRKTARERPNPTLTVSPAYNTSQGIPTPWLLTAAIDIPIETAGKRGYRLAQASQLSEAARWNIASVAWAVRSRIRQAMIELDSAIQTEGLLREQQTVQDENLRILENQFRAGAVSAFDQTQARIAADSTRLALREAERQRVEARVQLADALGVPTAALETARLSFLEIEELPNDVPTRKVRRQALLHRADLLGALAEYEASQAALQLEIAKQYPDIHLGPGYEFDQGDSKWSFGPSVTVPLLNRNQGAIGEAKARREEAAAAVVSLQAHAFADLERTVVGYRTALQKATDAESLRTSLLRQEKSAEAMLAAGEISKADLAAIRLQLSAASLARLDSLTKSWQAYGALEDAMQSGLGADASSWETSARTDGLHAGTTH